LAVGDECFKVYKSDDFGLTWDLTTAPDSGNKVHWGAMFTDPTGQHVVVGSQTGGSGKFNTDNGMIYSDDRGVTWATSTYNEISTKDLNFTTPFLISSDASGKHLLTIIQYSFSENELVESFDGGAKWSKVPVPPFQANYYGTNLPHASAISGNGKVMFTTNDKNEIISTQDAGATWTRGTVKPVNDSSQYYWENFVSDLTGKVLYANTLYGFYMSTDFGKTLKYIHQIPYGGSGIVAIACTPDGEYAYIMHPASMSIYTKKTDTFAVVQHLAITTDQSFPPYSVAVSDDGQHIVVGASQDGIYVSADGGATWKHTAKGRY
jgi:photosystem II stability/assembly factor-like uncharacterized protein